MPTPTTLGVVNGREGPNKAKAIAGTHGHSKLKHRNGGRQSSYRYSLLHKDAPSIRLVRLLAHSGGAKDKNRLPWPHIRCQLTLSYIDGVDRYEAVSYYWGNPENGERDRTVMIHVDGQRFLISPTVAAILSRLYKPDENRLLWIDLISIDQDNVEEKNIQVNRMKDIFSHAYRVIAWISPSNVPSKLNNLPRGGVPQSKTGLVESAMKVFATKKPKPSSESVLLSPWESRQSTSGVTPAERDVVVQFLHHPWFQRIWCVQEVAVAKELWIVSTNSEHSSKQVSRKSIRDFVITMEGEFRSPQWLGATTLDQGTATKLEQVKRLLKQNAPNRHLLELLRRYRPWQAYDPRDKVFALLNVCCDDLRQPDLQVNYSTDVKSLYTRIARYMIKRHNSLPALTHCANIPRNANARSPQLPTWVPDWSVPMINYGDDLCEGQRDMDEPITHTLKGLPRSPDESNFTKWRIQKRVSSSAACGSVLRVFGCRVGRVTSVFHDDTVEALLSSQLMHKGFKWPYGKVSEYLAHVSRYFSRLRPEDLLCILHGTTGIAVLRHSFVSPGCFELVHLGYFQFRLYGKTCNFGSGNAACTSTKCIEGSFTESDDRAVRITQNFNKQSPFADLVSWLKTHLDHPNEREFQLL